MIIIKVWEAGRHGQQTHSSSLEYPKAVCVISPNLSTFLWPTTLARLSLTFAALSLIPYLSAALSLKMQIKPWNLFFEFQRCASVLHAKTKNYVVKIPWNHIFACFYSNRAFIWFYSICSLVFSSTYSKLTLIFLQPCPR